MPSKHLYFVCMCLLLWQGCSTLPSDEKNTTTGHAIDREVPYPSLWSEEDFILRKNTDRSATDSIPPFSPAKTTNIKNPISEEILQQLQETTPE